MTWEERGGPPVKGPPLREGFGGGLARKDHYNSVQRSHFERMELEWLEHQDRNALGTLLNPSNDRLSAQTPIASESLSC